MGAGRDVEDILEALQLLGRILCQAQAWILRQRRDIKVMRRGARSYKHRVRCESVRLDKLTSP